MKNPIRSILLFCILTATPIGVISQVITPAGIDKLVESTLETFNVPGIAVTIVKDGQIVFAKGYGVRSLETGKI
ncbi:MAG: hypothetical protein WC865_02240 [Bacteroidales bacterium]